MFSFRKYYFFLTILLFAVLVFIALYVRDSFVRPYGGDFLVVIFLYCLMRSLFRISVKNAILGVLIFSYLIEVLQAFNIVNLLELEGNKLAAVVLGNHFEWLDMLLYTLGGVSVYLVERGRGETGKEQILNSEKTNQ